MYVDLCSLTHLATVLSIWFIIWIIPSLTQQWGLGSATPPWVKLINEKQLLCFRDWFVWGWNPTDVIPVGIYSKKPLKRILMSNNQNSIESIRVPPQVFFDHWLKWKEPTPLKVHRTDHLMKRCHGGWPFVDEGMKPVTWDETSLITLLFGPASQLTYFWCHFWNYPQTRSRLKELFSLLNQKKVGPVAIKSFIHGTGTFPLNLR